MQNTKLRNIFIRSSSKLSHRIIYKLTIGLVVFAVLLAHPFNLYAVEELTDLSTETASSASSFVLEFMSDDLSGLEFKDPTVTPTVTPEVIEAVRQDNPVHDAVADLTNAQSSIESARSKAEMKVKELQRKNYSVDEKVSVFVEHPVSIESLTARVIGPRGKEVHMQLEKKKIDEMAVLSLLPSSTQFTPGKYTVTIEDQSEGLSYEQNFSWGVLALNVDKSVYRPGETARIAIAVLDDLGMMVCDAKVELRIENHELGINDELSTENGRIKVNPECNMQDFTLIPDYETEYTVSEAGKYYMTLTATTSNTYSITDSFSVGENIPFDISRESATRIYPVHQYPVTISVTASEDFKGTLIETVPASFQVMPATTSAEFELIETTTASYNPPSTILGADTQLVMPFKGNRSVTYEFGDENIEESILERYRQAGVIGHDGIDFDLPIGSEVFTVDEGEVILAEENHDYGTTMVVRHRWGKSYYGHLSQMLKQKGEKIDKGEAIALSGNSGLSTDPHLHFGIKLNENNEHNGYYGKIDPSSLLGINTVEDVRGAAEMPQSEMVHVLAWDVELKKGETQTFSYIYKAPLESPQFYTLGPAQLYNGNDYVYGESRKWQIASDATETLYASSHITGTFTNPTNAVGSTTGNWAGQLNTNSNYTSRWAMSDPSGAITGTQTINILARKGSNSNNPTLQVNLYENGSLISSIIATTSITSTSGQVITGNFDASSITNRNNVEIEVVETGAGGSGSARNSAQIDYIEWVANLQPIMTVSSTGTQTASVSKGVSNFNIGGAFTFVTDGSNMTVSSITVSETGTIDAASHISNVDIYYETAATCTYNGVETLFGTDSTVSSEDAVVTGSMIVGSSQICVYVLMDVSASAATDATIEIEITNPSTEITVNTGTVNPSTAIAISGTTTVSGGGGGATLSQLMRHGKWFNTSGLRQPFTF